jgi:hypothetical protein
MRKHGGLTSGGDERRVQITGEEGVGQVAEELLEKGAHVVWVVVFVQLHIHPGIKLFS